jgi:hypothetical protein
MYGSRTSEEYVENLHQMRFFNYTTKLNFDEI